MKPTKPIRIGTRDSRLALWQAQQVQQILSRHNIPSELVPVKSDGDLDLVTPLYAMGVEGVFTKTLDAHLLSNRIDIAVHSMKDVPVQLPQGVIQSAVLERGPTGDVLVAKNDDYLNWKEHELNERIIATGSVRRKAQWWHRFPNHRLENIRGNLQTRMKKLEAETWQGAIFAAAGLHRMEMMQEHTFELDWMLPAPAQGAIMVVCREEDVMSKECCKVLNHEQTAACVQAERDFLAALMGGCATPISALATIRNGVMSFEGNILSPDGKQKFEVKMQFSEKDFEEAGRKAAADILEQGAEAVLALIRKNKLK
ncbi:hydroxymethylbilane synthase [Taibaiella lutea]|uniref:Hydroxymethylbilane synthase n=1 Tax=Taibaiella lutea TaxID=2608001 RepID=A0A5M6CIH9_9BACT|nr:hydroxymethylbilane synthase [Taibaiella lutea]KAA5534826.1 hydroxymethylbilane synthase [Taibaiella lutea]